MRYTLALHIGGFGGGLYEKIIEAEWLPRLQEKILVTGDGKQRTDVGGIYHGIHGGIPLVTARCPHELDEVALIDLGFTRARTHTEAVCLQPIGGAR